MESMRRMRPSPAMAVSILALVVAVGGTAIAGGGLTKSEKKQTRKIAANKVNELASGLSVASARSANTATNATNATNAGNADLLQGSSLAQVAPGAIGFLFSCSLTNMFQTCGTLDLTVNRSAKVLVVATTQWYSPDVAGTSVRAHCMIRMGMFSTSNQNLGTTANDTDANQTHTFTTTGQFFVSPGTSTFELRCLEDEGNVELESNTLIGFVVTG
jgi:hypothetical protein